MDAIEALKKIKELADSEGGQAGFSLKVQRIAQEAMKPSKKDRLEYNILQAAQHNLNISLCFGEYRKLTESEIDHLNSLFYVIRNHSINVATIVNLAKERAGMFPQMEIKEGNP